MEKMYTKNCSPYSSVEWVTRDAVITDSDGQVIHKYEDIEVPSSWSQLATNILASKYLRKADIPEIGRETSLKQLVDRVVDTITDYGLAHKYFDGVDAKIFNDELKYIMVNQIGCFNSPVLFNMGLYNKYQINGKDGYWHYDSHLDEVIEVSDNYKYSLSSACFILSVEDNLEDIFGLTTKMSKVFNMGSGVGISLSKLRAKGEKITGGGKSSGVISFLDVYDTIAASIKSGGKLRRSAFLACLEDSHPELLDFIQWKAREEAKAKALIDAGYDSHYEGEAYTTVSGQNTNVSVSVTDKFMDAYVYNKEWKLVNRTDDQFTTHQARDIMEKIAEASYQCADPGIQFIDSINRWNTTDQHIYSSNPCCLVGDMFLVTMDGHIKIEELYNMEILPQALSYNTRNKWLEYKPITKVWKKGIASKLVRISTSNGHIFLCTPEHEILTSKGYKPAIKLIRKDDLIYATVTGIDILVTTAIVYDAEVADNHNYVVSSSFDNISPIVFHNSEYLSPNNTACNLAAINISKFVEDNELDNKSFRHTIDLFITAQDILVDMCSYPTEEVAYNSHELRALGLGITDLGGTIMKMGLPYDCDAARLFTSNVFATLTGQAYLTSNRLARKLGRYKQFSDKHLDIIHLHSKYVNDNCNQYVKDIWDEVIKCKQFRNSQVTLCQPAGTTGLLMDSTTLGIEPDFSLVKMKKLSGGGVETIKNQLVEDTLRGLKYTNQEIELILERVNKGEEVNNLGLLDKDISIFHCANDISTDGHLKMLEAIQPYISGGISKTINLAEEVTARDIEDIYLKAWKMGIKCITIYRNQSKASQPLNQKNQSKAGPTRQRLSDTRPAIIHKFKVADHEGYLMVGLREDGQPGEVFINVSKEGTTVSGLLDTIGILISYCLQHGIPLEVITTKLMYTSFPPQGITGNEDIRFASSIIDYISKWLHMEFLDGNSKDEVVYTGELSEQICVECGSLMYRNGTCFLCNNCGVTTGCG